MPFGNISPVSVFATGLQAAAMHQTVQNAALTVGESDTSTTQPDRFVASVVNPPFFGPVLQQNPGWVQDILNPLGKHRKKPIILDGGMIVFYNPEAGGRSGYKSAAGVVSALGHQIDNGDLIIKGGLDLIKTEDDPGLRIPAMVKRLESSGRRKRLYVVVVGGDGTVAEVATAITESSSRENLYMIPLKGGIANDISRSVGAVKNPAKLAGWIAGAKTYMLDAAEVDINDQKQRTLLIHALTAGVSGELFTAMEEKRRSFSGFGMHLRYLPEMVRRIRKTRHFFAEVDSRDFITGEVIITGSTSLGGVATIPVPRNGFISMILPVNPFRNGLIRLTGVIPLSEGFWRKLIQFAGFRTFAQTGDVYFLDSDRQKKFGPGEEHYISFSGDRIRGVMNGDVIPEDIRSFKIKVLKPFVQVLAAPGSEMDLRKRKQLSL